MNVNIAEKTRIAFRDWLRKQLRQRDFYNKWGDRYLVREFHKWCLSEHDVMIDEASLGRYLRDEDPVIPTPERCRALATVFQIPAIDVMMQAGLVRKEDLLPPGQHNSTGSPPGIDDGQIDHGWGYRI